MGKGFTLLNHQLNELAFFARKHTNGAGYQTRGISRFTLRQILMDGLEQEILFSHRFTRSEVLPERTARAFFANGNSLDCELLVAADGTGSRVLKALGAGAKVVDTGSVAIIGKGEDHT